MQYGRIDDARHDSRRRFKRFVTLTLVLAAGTFAVGLAFRHPAPRATETAKVRTDLLALRDRCVADASALVSAVSAFDEANAAPGVGFEATGHRVGQVVVGDPASYGRANWAKRLLSGYFVATWPGDSPIYSVSLSTGVGAPGDVIVYVPASSPTGTDFNFESATTGCNQILNP
jgi:hypothetical protein